MEGVIVDVFLFLAGVSGYQPGVIDEDYAGIERISISLEPSESVGDPQPAERCRGK